MKRVASRLAICSLWSCGLLLLVLSTSRAEAQVAGAGPSPQLSAADTEAAAAVLRSYADAWRANDRATLLDLLADDVVLMPAGLGPIEGKAAAESFWFPDDGSTTTITAFAVEIEEVGGSGDLAFVRARSEFTFVYEEDGQSGEQTSRTMSLTLLRRQQGGGWKIARRIWGPLGDSR